MSTRIQILRQKEIVELLADAHRNVLVVGDDSQSIYSFRGANYEIFCGFLRNIRTVK